MRTHLSLVRFAALLALTCGAALAHAAPERTLKVCADPNNLPFSNEKRQGFENRIVEIVATELGARVEYFWWAQRRGNVRETLTAGRCDVIPGVASQLEMLATTQPYYRSMYVFVTRATPRLQLAGFDDERLRTFTIGVQMIGDDFSNTPPAHALARRGIVDNIRGYMVYGDYAQDSPSRTIMEDVARGVLDVAAVWGPLAGYYAPRFTPALALQPVSPLSDGPMLPMSFSISMGVRREDKALLHELNAALRAQRAQIEAVLDEFGVPRVEGTSDQ